MNGYPEKRKGIKICVIGAGAFAKGFIQLFKAHPYVEKVAVCDLIKENAEKYSKDFGINIVDSFEDVLKSEYDSVAIFVQRHLHGPLVIKALKSGKNVYSAVPMASTVEECAEIVELVKKTRLTYMMGETCYYYPCAVYCRNIYREGGFGKFIYGASQYYHDIAHMSYGKKPGVGGLPPMFYPTHSTGMILSAVNSYAVKLSAFGYEDTEGDNIFEKGANHWDNTISNTFSLMYLANGGTARVSECRRIGWRKPSSYISAVYGTKGGYEYSNAQHIYVRETKEKAILTDVSDLVNPAEMTANKHDPEFKDKVANEKWSWSSTAPVQDISRLPAEYDGLPTGHMGTHKLLVDDFCRAVNTGRLPPVNAWAAARYNIPGLVAHESALRGGELMCVQDCGNPPDDWEVLQLN